MILEEINYFNFQREGRNKESTGPVRRLSTEGLSDVFELYA
jgi:hypothetical protein